MSGGAVTLPAIRHREKKTPVNKAPVAMDLDAIRKRRIRLEAITNAKRFGVDSEVLAHRTRPAPAPSSASKIRKKHHGDTGNKADTGKTKKSVRLVPMSNAKKNPQGNELDRQRASDPLLKKTASKKQDGKKESPKKQETKKDAPKKQETKKGAPKKQETKKDASRKQETKKEVPKKQESKKDAPKKNNKDNKNQKKPSFKTKKKNIKPEANKKGASKQAGNRAGKGSRSYSGGNYFVLRDSDDFYDPDAYKVSVPPIEVVEPEPEPEPEYEPEDDYAYEPTYEEPDEPPEPDVEDVEAPDEPELEEPKELETYEIDEDPDIALNIERRTALRLLSSLKEPEQLEGATMARKHLSIAVDPPIDEYIASGAVPLLISLLDKHHNPLLQFEALWALTNIASGSHEQTKAVVDAGGISPIARLLSSSNPEVVDQAVWAIGNIAGDGPDLRDVVLHDRLVPLLEEARRKLSNPGAHRNMAWTISNLVRTKPCLMSQEDWNTCLQALKGYLRSNDNSVKLDAGWGLSYASDGDQEAIQRVIDLNILKDVAQMLTSDDQKIAKVALRIAGNIVSGNDSQTDLVIGAGIVPRLLDILKPENQKSTSERKEAAWALSNITAGSCKQIQNVFDAGAVPILMNIMKDETTAFSVSKEVIWCLGNSSNGEPAQVDFLVKEGVIPVLVNFLDNHSTDAGVMFPVILDFIANVLERTTEKRQLRSEVRNLQDGLQTILETAEKHDIAPDICQKIKEFMHSKDDEKDEEKEQEDDEEQEEEDDDDDDDDNDES